MPVRALRLGDGDVNLASENRQNPINARKGITTQEFMVKTRVLRYRQNPINARKGITTTGADHACRAMRCVRILLMPVRALRRQE